MKKAKIAINGFGRIGRIFFRQAFGNSNLDFVAINDLGSLENLAYLLKYDSVYGNYDKSVDIKNGNLVVDGHEIKCVQEKDPGKLPWGDLGVDIVVESTGVFESRDKAAPHLDSGAKRVVITAPAKDEITPTVTPNVNVEALKLDKITSNASCTTNAATPVMSVMMANPGVEKATLNTVHGYTASQSLVDSPDPRNKDYRRARAAGVNIVPTSTGAALAATKAVPPLKDKFDGIALRVPVISGSIMDFTFLASRKTSVEEVNDIFKKAAEQENWKGILTVTDEPLVSSDILRNPHGSIIDLAMTRVIDGDLVKVLAWYDNEWGYGAMLAQHVLTVAQLFE